MIEYKEVKYGKHTCVGYEKISSGSDSGDVGYYLDGKEHRIDGPAVIYKGGYQAWYINGIFHREDGPARTWPDGDKEYWLNGVRILPNSYHLFTPLQLAKLGLI